jgi:hypothetical protein
MPASPFVAQLPAKLIAATLPVDALCALPGLDAVGAVGALGTVRTPWPGRPSPTRLWLTGMGRTRIGHRRQGGRAGHERCQRHAQRRRPDTVNASVCLPHGTILGDALAHHATAAGKSCNRLVTETP